MAADFGFEPVCTGKKYFVCYKYEDAERVGEIARHLNNLGVPMWYDYGISYGAELEKQISRNISECEAVILFASETMFSHEGYLRVEYDLALALEKKVCVVWLDDVSLTDVNADLKLWYMRMKTMRGVEVYGNTPENAAKSIKNILNVFQVKSDMPLDLSTRPASSHPASALPPHEAIYQIDENSKRPHQAIHNIGEVNMPPYEFVGHKTYVNPGSYSFEEAVRSEIYVDKTEMIHYLNTVVKTKQKYVCVSRPRRFGKTMAADMLCAYYGIGTDSYDLFSRLKLSSCPDITIGKNTLSWDTYLGQFDIIRLVITDFMRRVNTVQDMINALTDAVSTELMEVYSGVRYGTRTDLIDVMNGIYVETGRQFVVVIDEWDAVFRVRKEDKAGQTEYLNFLRDWLKDKPYIALAYMTGILSIKKYGEHSALNMFTEYSMIAPMNMARFTGFTDDEVRELCKDHAMDYDAVSNWYDGYLVSDQIPESMREAYRAGNYADHKISLYSPLSVVNAVRTGHIRNYWNKTETYEALAEYIRRDYDGLKEAVAVLMEGGRLKVDTSTYQNDMTTFHGRDDVFSLLIHLGYLGYDAEQEEVFIPNREILDEFRTSTKTNEWAGVFQSFDRSLELLKATWACDEEKVAEMLEDAHDHTENKTYNSEAAFSYSIQYAYYAAQKYYTMIPELDSGKGYADVVFIPVPRFADKPVLLIELKYDKDADTAISQIKRQKYPERLEHYKGNILLVGINYNKDVSSSSPHFKHHTCRIEKA